MKDIKEHTYSVEEYFEQMLVAEERLEYHDGEIKAMSGGTANHAKLIFDTGQYLASHTRQPCEPFNSDMAVAIPNFNRYVYPDIVFVCEEEQYEDDRQLVLLNPGLVIEVLSPGTENRDRSEKFSWYRSLPSFREYILIASEKVSVETFYKASDELWKIGSAYRLDQSVYIHTLDIELPLQEIYRRVSFR